MNKCLVKIFTQQSKDKLKGKKTDKIISSCHFPSSYFLNFKANFLTNAIAFLKVKGTVYRHKIDHKLDTVNLKTNYFAVVLLICKLVRILLVQACKRSLLPKLNG